MTTKRTTKTRKTVKRVKRSNGLFTLSRATKMVTGKNSGPNMTAAKELWARIGVIPNEALRRRGQINSAQIAELRKLLRDEREGAAFRDAPPLAVPPRIARAEFIPTNGSGSGDPLALVNFMLSSVNRDLNDAKLRLGSAEATLSLIAEQVGQLDMARMAAVQGERWARQGLPAPSASAGEDQ
jgi:hypothetical protein